MTLRMRVILTVWPRSGRPRLGGLGGGGRSGGGGRGRRGGLGGLGGGETSCLRMRPPTPVPRDGAPGRRRSRRRACGPAGSRRRRRRRWPAARRPEPRERPAPEPAGAGAGAEPERRGCGAEPGRRAPVRRGAAGAGAGGRRPGPAAGAGSGGGPGPERRPEPPRRAPIDGQLGADLGGLVLADQDLQQDAGDRRRDLGVDLVGGDLEQRLVGLDGVADLPSASG